MMLALLASATIVVQLPAPMPGTQKPVPIVVVSPPSARSVETVGTVLGVREVKGGKLLVNDAGRRQIRLFDSTLASSTIIADSAAGGATSYGAFPMPLIPYLGDSSLFPDFQSRALLVYDGTGRVARVVAVPGDGVLESLIGNPAGVDTRGRLLFKDVPSVDIRLSNKDPALSKITQPPDSALIMRADFASRRIDTIGRVSQPSGRLSAMRAPDGRAGILTTINPLPTVDEWAMLSDGTIAFVRGRDYHVDWIHADGSASATPKMPFDWKRVTDDDKQKLVDSARASEDAKAARVPISPPPTAQVGTGGGRGAGGAPPAAMAIAREVAFVPLNEIADYYPPIRRNAATADFEGNLWILPSTSAQSMHGELIYDVVHPREGLVRRVRMPEGRFVAGFGKGGVVYLMSGDKTNGFRIERATISAR